MGFPDISAVKQAAARQVRQAGNATRLMAIHAGTPAAISLVLTLLSFILSQQISGTGGLGGLGLRTALEAAQNMLQVVSTAFSLFWIFGLTAISLHWSRGEAAREQDLFAGFRRWGAVLRSTVLKVAVYVAVVLVASQISSLIFSMTPLAGGMMALAEKMMADLAYMPTDAELLDAVLPYLPFFGITLAALAIPVSYRLRMMDYVLMDEPRCGAFYALRMSLYLTRRNCLKLLRLDLSFWWFYLLELVAAVVYYGDAVLQLAGIETKLSDGTMLFIACTAGMVLQTALYIWRQGQVATAYAMVYEALKPRPVEKEA